MTRQLATQTQQQPPTANPLSKDGILQRQCESCGQHTIAGGACAECGKKSSLQRKLTIGASHDPLEQEADRVADQVMAASAQSSISSAPPRIQRFTGQASERIDTAPASVDRVLASSGRPLEPSLQQDMGQRFRHDFSRVRIHTDAAADRSAQDVNANAYTIGHNVVFGAGRFAPGTHEGRRLIAHELTHVVQQSGSDEIRVDQHNEKRGLSPISQWTPTPQFQRQPRRRQAGTRDATVEVHWSEDADKFYDRLVAALVRSAGFGGVDASAFESVAGVGQLAGFRIDAKSFHIVYNMHHSDIKEGQRIKLHVSAYFNPDPAYYTPKLSKVKISTDEKPVSKEALAPGTTTAAAQKAPPKKTAPAEEAFGAVTWSAGKVSVVWVNDTPKSNVPDESRIGALIQSEVSYAHPEREPADDSKMMLFYRDPGEKWFLHWAYHWPWRITGQPQPQPQPPSERELLDEYGIPNPKKMWTEINEKWVAELKESAVMVGTFALTEIATWIIGGALLKILGKGLVRLPKLYRLIRGGRAEAKAIEEGLAKLIKTEAEELGRLLKRANAGEKLSAAEVKRLEELAARLETELASMARAAAAKVGLSAGDLALLEQGELVFSKLVRGQTEATAMFGLEKGKLTAGILNIKTPIGADAWNSVKTFLAFKNGSMELAQQLGASTLRLEGNIVLNPGVKELLLKQGYVEFTPNNFFLELLVP